MSTIIIRLQNLPLEANSLDIRRFFQGLHIPDGGVHIVGGENGDAFIAFGGDEDARQAMERNGNLIKNSRIKLLLSSRNEMQKIIDNARTQTLGMVGGSVPGGAVGRPPLGPTPPIQPNVQYGSPQGQYPPQQSAPPQNMPGKPINLGPPPSYGQMYAGGQGPPAPGPAAQSGMNMGYGLPPQVKSEPIGDSYQRQPFRARSRSRSPPPTRMPHDGPPPALPSMAPLGNMQSGLMGALQQQQTQQPPPQQPSIQQSYGQNGAFPQNNVNANNQMPPQQPQQQGPYDGGNYYQQQQQRSFSSSGSGDERWNAPPPSNNNMGPMMNQQVQNGLPPQDTNYRQNDMYRNQPISNIGPPPQQQQPNPFQAPPPQQQQQQQMPPYQQPGQSMLSNEPMSQQNQIPPPQQQQQGRLFTLQLWNLPLNTRPSDLISFFAPLYLYEENIKIFTDERGFPTGVALVRFPTLREFDTALSNNGRYIADRQIQVRPLDEMSNGNLNNAGPPPPMQNQQMPPQNEPFNDPNYPPGFRASPGPTPDVPYTNTRGPSMSGNGQPPYPPPPHQGGPNKELVVYMKGLPFTNCTIKDVETFFQPIRPVNIEIERDNRGKPSGNAFVEFENRIDYDRGMEYNMKHMGRRYIELIPLLKFEKFGPRAHGGGGGVPFPERNGPPNAPTYCISVKGLGPEVTSQDLKIYFGNAGARPFAVHIMLTPAQMNAGEAFLEFIDKESHKRALKRDGDIVGRDRITVRPVAYELVMNALGRPIGPMGGGGGGGPPPRDFFREGKGGRGGRDRRGGPHPPPFQDDASILLALECSGKAKDEDFCVFFEKFKITPDRLKTRQNPDGTIDAQISFLNRNDAEHAHRTMDGKYFLGRNMRLKFM